MKAKKVYENIKFERGTDPKDALQIGPQVTIALDNGWPYTGPKWNLKQAKAIQAKIKEAMDQERSYRLDDDLESDSLLNALDAIAESYEDELAELGFKYDEAGWDMDDLYENLEFERGKDPKASMGIGPEALKEELWEKFNNDYDYMDHLEPVSARVYRGIKALCIKYRDNRKAYTVVWWEPAGEEGYTYGENKRYRRTEEGAWKLAERNIDEKFDSGWIKESQKFERGRDPKMVLGVGHMESLTQTMREFANKYGFTEVRAYDSDDPRLTDDPGERHGLMVAKWVDGYGKELILYIDDRTKPPAGENLKVYWRKSWGDDKGPAIHWKDEDAWKWFSDLKESLEFERGKDPKAVLGIGLHGLIDTEAKKEGLTVTASVPILSAPGPGPRVGTTYQWQDQTGANMIEFIDYDAEESEPQFWGMNSEEGTVSLMGAESITKFFKSGKFNKWINLE